jgi:proteasome lid subunit RPN8/RPN11
MTLRLAPEVYKTMIGHCYDGLPDEAAGLIAGAPGSDKAHVVYPTRNEAESSRVYAIDGLEYMRVERDADDRGLEILGVFHSHTHTEAYPSPTDVERAELGPQWHYVIVSLKDVPVVRSYRIVDGNIAEEPLVLEGR